MHSAWYTMVQALILNTNNIYILRMRKKFTKQTKVLKNLSGSMLQLCSRPLGFLEQVATESELIAVTELVRSS